MKVDIPKYYFSDTEIDGECGFCRFKSSTLCLLFNKETDYDWKEQKPKRLKECIMLTNSTKENTNVKE